MRRCVWGWRLNDAQRETASLSRYAAVHVLRPERADTGGACQLPVFRQGDGDYSERCGARGAGEGCGMKAERHQARNSSGECVLSQSAKAELMRVCQPGPEDLKVSNTS